MAINDTQKTDFLWKRIIFGTTETDITGKGGPNETVPSPVPTYIQNIWGQGDLVPVPAAPLANVVQEYGIASALQCTADPTVAGNYTWFATSVQGDITSRTQNWVAPTFDPGYLINVYNGNPNTGGTKLNQGSAGDEWVYDYISGTLHFPNGPPSGLSQIWLIGYRYVGTLGVTTGGSGSAPVTTYADNTARDADTATVAGDLAYVVSSPDGEYALYMATSAGPSGSWSLLATEDSAEGDSKTLRNDLAFGTGATTTMGNASQNTRVINTVVEVTQAFSAGAEVEVGITGDTAIICDAAYVDLQTVGTYQVSSNYLFSSTTDTGVLMTYAANGATAGAATVTVTFA